MSNEIQLGLVQLFFVLRICIGFSPSILGTENSKLFLRGALVHSVLEIVTANT